MLCACIAIVNTNRPLAILDDSETASEAEEVITLRQQLRAAFFYVPEHIDAGAFWAGGFLSCSRKIRVRLTANLIEPAIQHWHNNRPNADC